MEKFKDKKYFQSKKYIKQQQRYAHTQSFERRKVEQQSSDDSSTDVDDSEKKQLRPIGDYMNDRNEMVEQMFKSIRGRHLNMILPDVLKDVPLAELRRLCVYQLEVMSKKRIRCILAGKEMTSSSGTEDSTTEEEENDVSPQVAQRRSISSPEEEMPQPDSTSVDQPTAVVEQVVKETIESDENFSDDVVEEKNEEKEEENVDDKNSVELEEPVFDFLFDDTSDDELRSRVLAKRTAVEFESAEENDDVELDSGVVRQQATINREEKPLESASVSSSSFENYNVAYNKEIYHAVADDRKRSLSCEEEETNVEYDADSDSELEEGEIRNDRKRKKLKRTTDNNNDATKSASDQEQESLDSNSDEGEMRRLSRYMKRKKFCRLTRPVVAEDEKKIEETRFETEEKMEENFPAADLPSEIAEEEKTTVCPDISEQEKPVEEENFQIHPPEEVRHEEPLDVDLRPSDDVWLLEKNADNGENSTKDDVSIADEKLEFVDEVGKNFVGEKSEIFFVPKPPPGVTTTTAENDQAVDCDYEDYDSDDERMKSLNIDNLVPPGFEPPTRVVASDFLSNNANIREEIDEEPTTSHKKTSIVPIKVLYGQLKAQKQRKKDKPKIYGAQLPAWSVEKIIAPAGPKLPSLDEIRAIELEKGVKFLDDDDERKIVDEPEKNSDELKNEPSSTSPTKTKKKKSKVLTDEFLSQLAAQKREHEEEMQRKATFLEQLKEKRLNLMEKEKETEEKLKKQIELGMFSSSSSYSDDDVDVDELILFANEAGGASEIFTGAEEGECSGAEEENTTTTTGPKTFNLVELKSFSISFNQQDGTRNVVINEKAEKMKSAFDLPQNSEPVVYSSYAARTTENAASSSKNSRIRSHWRKSDDDDDRTNVDDKSVAEGREKQISHRKFQRNEFSDDSQRSFSRSKKIDKEKITDDYHKRRECKNKSSSSSKKSEKSTSKKRSSTEEKRVEIVKIPSKSTNQSSSKNWNVLKSAVVTPPIAPMTIVKIPSKVTNESSSKSTNSNASKSAVITPPIATTTTNVDKITAQKLELYELEMRARAIRALMKKQEEMEKNNIQM